MLHHVHWKFVTNVTVENPASIFETEVKIGTEKNPEDGGSRFLSNADDDNL
jgi:hypothetical protein